jgi:hypothetical protein
LILSPFNPSLTSVSRIATIPYARTHGDVAQLGERCLRKAEAEGSNPFISTMTCQRTGVPRSAFLLCSGVAHGFARRPRRSTHQRPKSLLGTQNCGKGLQLAPLGAGQTYRGAGCLPTNTLQSGPMSRASCAPAIAGQTGLPARLAFAARPRSRASRARHCTSGRSLPSRASRARARSSSRDARSAASSARITASRKKGSAFP